MVFRVLFLLVMLCYPVIVYVGLRAMRARDLALLLGAFLAIRLAEGWRHRDRQAAAAVTVPIAAVGVVVLLGGVLDDGRLFLYVPVLVNLTLLVTFARTLRRGPSMVESLARLSYSTLAPGATDYCRRVTMVWCAFFTANVVIIGSLAVAQALAAWTLYTGLIAYAVIGCLFAVEMTYRAWRFRHYTDAPMDALFRRIFPPRSPA
jgi:uncharacterized membrane protein